MHSEELPRLRPGPAANRLYRWLAVLFPFSIAGSVVAQNVLAPPPGFQGAGAVPTMGNFSGSFAPAPGAPAGQTTASANGQQPAAPATGEANATANGETPEIAETAKASVAAPAKSFMAWGSTHVHLRASYQFLYSTGLNAAPGQSADTYTHTITPAITVVAGPHLSLDYSPSLRFFSNKEFHNTLDHYLDAIAGAHLGNWTFGTTHSLAITDEPEVQTASQTSETIYSGGVNASYQATEKVSFNTSASGNLLWTKTGNNNVIRTNAFGGPGLDSTNLPPLNNSANFSAGEMVMYAFDPSIAVGAGVTGGYSSQSGGFDSVNEQYSGTVQWRPGPKLNVSVSGGIEVQQYLNENTKDMLSPIYSATVLYHLFEQTGFSLSANRSVSPSLFQNQVTDITQLGVGVQQRLLGLVQLSLGFSYFTSDYKMTVNNSATARSDQGTSYSAGLSFPFLKHGTFGAYYQYSHNSSSAAAFGYSSSQVGATLSWAY